MPAVSLNRKTLEILVGKKLSDDDLKKNVPALGASLEKLDKLTVDIEVPPNRPDFLSEQGFARALSSFLGVAKGLKKYSVKSSHQKVIVDSSVKGIRPFTACAVVKGIKFDDEKIKEIIQIQEKLHTTFGRKRKKAAIGVYPLEKIKFPITYFAEDPKKVKFRPLESDREMTGLDVLSKHPTGREYAHLVEGLDKFAFFKDSTGAILSMPPIINSHDVGKISESTVDVFVECSGFDFDVLKKCLNMIVAALADMGGEIYSIELDYGSKKELTPDLSHDEMKIDYVYVNRILGTDLSHKEIDSCLEHMGFGVKDGMALIPAYRADVLHQIDLVEDVAIAHGYDNFKPLIPRMSTIGKESGLEKFKNRVAGVLVGLGLLEVETFNLTSEAKQCSLMEFKADVVRLHNALNKEYDVLRYWLIPSMIEVLQTNLSREYPHNLFGIGDVFKYSDSEDTGVVEQERLAVALCSDEADFTKIKQILDFLMRMLDLKYEIRDVEHSSFISGRVGRVSVNGKDVAYIGEISPEVLSNFSLEMPVSVFELNLSELYALMQK